MNSTTLPIEEHRGAFESALSANPRIVMTAETGAGKSTRIPVWLSEIVDGLVLVVEPRRVACDSLADFLAEQAGQKTGEFFGSRVRFSDRSGNETRVLFCTPGVALRMLAEPKTAEKLGALVVDEFHERSWQMDLTVAAAVSLRRFADVPLILTSATIDADQASDVLGAQTLHAQGRTFPVEISYDESTTEPSSQDLDERAARAIERATKKYEGDVLVFLPGMKEIRGVERALGKRHEDVVIVHGSQPPELLRKAFRASSKRRIFLSTNIAETSITLPGVRVVIDSGLARGRVHKAGRAALTTNAISEASMDQRSGRAGRVAAGHCIRLWSERYRPSPHPEPEIARTELDDLLIQAAQIGLSGERFAKATWITPPPEFAVERAQQRLAGLGALKDGGLTPTGEKLSKLPVSAEQASLLVDAPDAIRGTVCDLVALTQTRGTLLMDIGPLSPGRREDVKEARVELLKGVTDEVSMGLTLIREGDVNRHHLSGRRLKEARAISKQLSDLVGGGGYSRHDLAEFILGRLPESGFVLRPRAAKQTKSRSQPWANGVVEVNVYPFDPVDPEAKPSKSKAAVILETEWLGTGSRIFGIGRMLLPTKLEVLAKAGLGTPTLTEVRLDKKRGIRVYANRSIELAGVILDASEAKLAGPELCQNVAMFLLQGRVFKGARDAIEDNLFHAKLVRDWPDAQDLGGYTPKVAEGDLDAQTWLTDRLLMLGVETSNDLSLLETEDLVADIEELTGVPQWALQPLLDEFPRAWVHQDAVYSCEVRPSARKVIMRPDNGVAKKRGEPLRALIPRFRGFSVEFHQASRKVKLR